MPNMSKSNGGQVQDEAPEGGSTIALAPPEIKAEDIGITTSAIADSVFPAPIEKPERRGAVIAIDIDDTIAGYVQGFIRQYGWPDNFEGAYDKNLFEVAWPMADLGLHFSKNNHIEFCKGLLPVPLAFSSCQILLTNGFPIIYLTRRPQSHKQMTLEWLENWGFPVAPLYCTGSADGKKLMMQNLDIAAIVDDRAEDIFAARDMGLATFIIDRPWNRQVPGLYRCFGWTHVLEVIDTFWLPIGG